MKNQVRKSVLPMVLSLAVVVSGLVCLPSKEAQATETAVVEYVTVEQAAFEERVGQTAPTKDGYLFAGWVAKKTDGTGVAIKTTGDEVLSETGVTITAKFIKANLAGVACQAQAGAHDESAEGTELRVVSVVDGGTYKELGFNLYRRQLMPGTTDEYKENLICGYKKETGTNTNAAAISDKYSGLYQYDSSTDTTPEIVYPETLFGNDAKGFYFTTARIGTIPKRVYDSCIFVIRPYWVTADGTYVEGLAEYDRVSDGKNGIANISVNIKEAEAIAAGKMTITYDDTKFSYVGADVGRVFEEMEINAGTSGKVNCVGNVENIANNSLEPNDVFVNLRFQRADDNLSAGTATFAISGTEFCDNNENDATAKVWDVTY